MVCAMKQQQLINIKERKKEKKRKIRISMERKQLQLLAECICFHKRKFSKKEFNTGAINCRNIDNFQVTFKNRN